ncbi:MAG: hypothetical protein NUV97_00755 [archaeon]|nr:hypothetical protein [archaeon]MCR4323359.1 hypothetical protein [Nanoarchaeota archaeon]
MNLGVDESNHGKVPEIFVGCFSANPEDALIEEEGTYSKRRSNQIQRPCFQIPFKHLLFSEDHKRIVGAPNLPLIAVGTLASFVYGAYSKLGGVYLDGELNEAQTRALEKILHSICPGMGLFTGAALDTRVRLVNEADNRANMLHRYYSQGSGGRRDKYLDSLLDPQIRRFRGYLI